MLLDWFAVSMVALALGNIRLGLILGNPLSLMENLLLRLFFLRDINLGDGEGLLFPLDNPDHAQRDILLLDRLLDNLLRQLHCVQLLIKLLGRIVVGLISLAHPVALALTEAMGATVPADPLAAVALLETYALQVLLVPHLPLHLLHLEHALPLPQQDVDVEGHLRIPLVQVHLLHLNQALLPRSAPLVVVGLDVVDHLLFGLICTVVLLAVASGLLPLVVESGDLLAVDESLLDLLAQVGIFGPDFILNLLDDGEGELVEGGGFIFATVSQHLS
jgi:hypothetical protein